MKYAGPPPRLRIQPSPGQWYCTNRPSAHTRSHSRMFPYQQLQICFTGAVNHRDYASGNGVKRTHQHSLCPGLPSHRPVAAARAPDQKLERLGYYTDALASPTRMLGWRATRNSGPGLERPGCGPARGPGLAGRPRPPAGADPIQVRSGGPRVGFRFFASPVSGRPVARRQNHNRSLDGQTTVFGVGALATPTPPTPPIAETVFESWPTAERSMA